MNVFTVVKPVSGQISCVLSCCNAVRVAPFIQFHSIYNTFPLKNIKVLVILLGMMTVFFTPAFSAITQVGTTQSAYVTGKGNRTLTLAKPAGLTAGDIMIVSIVKYNGSISDPTAPTGWTKIDARGLCGSSYDRGAVFYRIANGSEGASFSFTIPGTVLSTTYAEGALIAYTGVDLLSPFDVTPGTITTPGAAATTVSPVGITTVSNNALVLMLGLSSSYYLNTCSFDSWSVTTSPSLTELYDLLGAEVASVGAASGIKDTAGATGNGTITLSLLSYAGGIILALRPKSPTITSFTPISTCKDAGTSITITGINFTGATAVSINGSAASFTVNSNTQITATVPVGAASGFITVTTPYGTAQSVNPILLKAPPVPEADITPTTCSTSTDGAIRPNNIPVAVNFSSASSQYVNLNTPLLSNLSAFTIEGWVKTTSYYRNSFFGQNDAIEFGLTTDGKVELWSQGVSIYFTSATVYPQDGQWHHVAGTGNGSVMTIYVDGVIVGTTSHNATTNYGTSSFNTMIGGGVWNGTGDYTNGQILKVGFWNKALTQNEIAALASTPMGYKTTDTGLIAGYNFYEGTGTSLSRIPAGTAGTLTATQTWSDLFTYSWSKTGGGYSTTTKNITGLSTGTYSLAATFNGCTSNSAGFVVGYANTESVAPTGITGNTSVAYGNSTTLTVSGGSLGGGASWKWYSGSCGGALVGTGSSVTVSPVATTTYYVRAEGTCNITSCAAITVRMKNYWIGTQSTVWSNAANWSHGVPASGDDVEFATTSNYITAAVKDLILDADYVIGNLTNASNYKLIIPTARTLRINGVASSNSADRILVQSASGVANGSLIFTQPALNSALQASVEMYSKAFKGTPITFLDPVTGETYTVSFHWQYFGIPVQSAVYSSIFTVAPVSYVRVANETKNGNTVYYDEWTQLYDADLLYPFKGYEITQNISQGSGKLITFKGALVTADQTLTLTKTTSGTTVDTGSGANIFGNSFTAAIDINKIVFPSSGVEKTVYLYNTGSLKEWSDYYDDAEGQLVAPGSYYAVPQNTSPIIQREIPSMQGFMLMATTNNSIVTIPYSSVLNNTLPQRVPSLADEAFSYLTVDVLGKSAADRVWLFSHPETSHRYDNGWDGRKMSGTEGLSLFVDENPDQLQVSTSENLDKTYLSLIAGKDTEYALRINKKHLSDYKTLYLTDLVTKKVTDLSGLDEISYTFTATNTAKSERRFLITSKDSKPNNEQETKKVDIFSRGNAVMINNPSDASGVVRIFDMIGQLRYTTALQENSVTAIRTVLPPAIYVVRVTATGIDQSEKIMIHH
ncbi:MAG: hypothetical protein H6Q19_257 [Bacteroidetes bacterium]|nr:hypothetical protein [Bacteroidota bacterium]